MRILTQILKEFGLPLVVALTWAWFRASSAQDNWWASFISNLAGSFFFASWICAQFMRIKRQHEMDDRLSNIGEQLAQSGTTMKALTTKVTQILEQVKNAPALQPLMEDVSELIETANTQIVLANNAVAEARNTVPFGWQSDWALPQRLVPNPKIYEMGSPTPPLPLIDEQSKK